MENAVEALKIAFAIFVFVIALALAFSVIGQAKATSDVMLSLNDKTADLEYVNQNDTNAINKERIVTFETILPTIYRYAEEQYAVTIYTNDGIPIARFDLWTEGFMGDWDLILRNYRRGLNDAVETVNNVQERLNIIQNQVNGKNFKFEWLDDLYKVSSSNNASIRHGSPWVGNSLEIIKRINCDISTGKYTRNGISYNGKNLNQFKDKKFKEKFIEIQTSGETIIETDDENNIEYSLETIKGNKKLEIIYIMQ